MFICNRCLALHYSNRESMVKSIGNCEVCHTKIVCNDIPSVYLKPTKSENHEKGREVIN